MDAFTISFSNVVTGAWYFVVVKTCPVNSGGNRMLAKYLTVSPRPPWPVRRLPPRRWRRLLSRRAAGVTAKRLQGRRGRLRNNRRFRLTIRPRDTRTPRLLNWTDYAPAQSRSILSAARVGVGKFAAIRRRFLSAEMKCVAWRTGEDHFRPGRRPPPIPDHVLCSAEQITPSADDLGRNSIFRPLKALALLPTYCVRGQRGVGQCRPVIVTGLEPQRF